MEGEKKCCIEHNLGIKLLSSFVVQHKNKTSMKDSIKLTTFYLLIAFPKNNKIHLVNLLTSCVTLKNVKVFFKKLN